MSVGDAEAEEDEEVVVDAVVAVLGVGEIQGVERQGEGVAAL